jgi:hypothetical protein
MQDKKKKKKKTLAVSQAGEDPEAPNKESESKEVRATIGHSDRVDDRHGLR